MKFTKEDTIAAIATPPGIGAISIIRISGPNAFEAMDSFFLGKSKIISSPSHTIHYGKIINSYGELIDDVLVSVFKEPNSYTGEDCVEISTHGNPLITKKIIELLLTKNVRMAEPGEFTKRAFLNNRIDLTQAEAVADVIMSRTDASLRGARNQLDGLLSKKVNELRNFLINTSSFIELELDFAEEDLEFIEQDKLKIKITTIIKEIDDLLSTYHYGRILKDGVNVALVGKPNVGKSSILNYILKESRAIVSKIPGTTRDVIREEVSIDGILYRLFDTAGIRISEDEIEKEGVFRSRESTKNADIVFLIGDIEQGIPIELGNELSKLADKNKTIKILNKIDLLNGNKVNDSYDLYISALTGEGMEDLFKKLKDFTLGNSNYSEKNAVVSSLRHYNCLKKAREYLQNALTSISEKQSGEFISVDLRNAENILSEIIGEVTSDDILNNIFMKFCIGK